MKEISVIYEIINIINGHRYIGSAISFNDRETRHLWELKKNIHHCEPLQRAYNKYGENNLNFNILEIVDDINYLIIKEQDYFNKLNPEYNVCKVAGSILGIKRTEQTKLKMSKSLKGKKMSEEFCNKCSFNQRNLSKEAREKRDERIRILGKRKKGVPHSAEHIRKISQSNTGKKHSKETKDLLRMINTGRKQSKETIAKRAEKMTGKIHSKETRLKISRNQPGRKKIDQFDLNKNFIKSFDSITDAAKELNIIRTCIIRHLKGGTKRYKQWIFKYA